MPFIPSAAQITSSPFSTQGQIYLSPVQALNYTTVGTWATFNSTVGPTVVDYSYNSSAAQNDLIYWDLGSIFPVGTYDHQVAVQKNTSHGIQTWEVSPDTSAWSALTTIDCYNGGGSIFGVTLTTGISLVAFRYVRSKAATKNASSSGYQISIGPWTLTRQA